MISYTTYEVPTGNVVRLNFSFERFSELKAGETISSATIEVISGGALTIGTVTTSGAVAQALCSGFTTGTLSVLRCTITTSGGSTRSQRGGLVGVAA